MRTKLEHILITGSSASVRLRRILVLVLMTASMAVVAAPPVGATTIVVSDEAGYRAALNTLSMDNNGPHAITLSTSIVLAGATDPLYFGTQNLTIFGAGFTLDGAGNSRVLQTTLPALLRLENVTITGGNSPLGFGGAVSIAGPAQIDGVVAFDNHVTGAASSFGGFLSARGDTLIVDSVLRNNTATSGIGNAGGGAVSTGIVGSTLTVERVVATGNQAIVMGSRDAFGGAFSSLGPVEVTDSMLANNLAQGGAFALGGALSGRTTVTVTGSSLVANRAVAQTRSALGAALSTRPGTTTAATITNSTFAGNTLDSPNALSRGSAIDVPTGSLALSNSTVTDNRVLNAGTAAVNADALTLAHVTIAGDDVGAAVVADVLTSEATVVSGQTGTGAASCAIGTSTTSGGFNYDDDGTCGFGAGAGDVSNGADPLLGEDRNNGDLAPAANATVRTTMYPLNGSPLIDAIPALSCSAAPELDLDERGVDRPFGIGCDIGAIESVFPAHGFSDVSPFYESTVRWVTSTVNTPQILLGFDANTFGHQLDITRGQAARLYYRAAGAPSVGALPPHGFTDVSVFFEDAVRWTKAQGIFDGYPDNTFRQDNPINRGNYTRSLYGFAGSAAVSGLPPHGFTDVSAFYENAVRWVKGHGLADGFDDNTYRQNNNITRGNASRTAYNTAQTPTAWNTPNTAPANMLFRPNTF